MDKQQILDFMDAEIENTRECHRILESLGANVWEHQRLIDAMVVSRAKFWEVNQKELR